MLIFPPVSGNRKRFACIFLFTSLFLLGSGTPPLWAADQAGEILKIARSFYDSKQYDRAIGEYKQFLTNYPNHSARFEANYFLAESLIEKNRPDEAFIYLDAILSNQLSAMKTVPRDSFFDINYYRVNIQPKMSPAHDLAYGRLALFRAGEIAYRIDDLENGRRFLFAFLVEFNNDPFNASTLPYLGDIAMQNYQIAIAEGYNAVSRIYAEEAEYYFGTTIEVYPGSLLYKESLFGLGWAKARLGKYAEATQIFRQLALTPKSTRDEDNKLTENAYYEWGLMHYEQGNYQQAITTLQNFEREYPRSDFRNDSLRVRAKSLAGLEKYQEALDLISQINAVKVEDYLLQIRCHYGMKNYEEASKLLAALDQNPISQSVKDEIRLLQAGEAFIKNDRNSAILILETLLRPKYTSSTKQMTFAYYDPPERGRGRPDGGNSSNSLSGEVSRRGKLSEEKFLKACAILCINYAIVGRTDESNATINAMMLLANPDDARQSQVIDRTFEYLAGVRSGTVNNSNSGTLAGGEPIPIDPGRDGGIYFGPIIDDRDLKPAGGSFDPNRGGNRGSSSGSSSGNSGNQNSSNSGRLQNSGDRYANNSSRGPNNSSGSRGDSGNVPKTAQEFRRELQNCQALVRSRKWEEADQRLLTLLGNNPPADVGAEAAFLRCQVLLELGQESEAELMCDLILNEYRKTVQYADALWVSGIYYEKRGNLDKAFKRFQILADDYPNSDHAAGALFHLAWDDLESGNKRAAMLKFRKIHSTYRDSDYWSHGTWGLAYLAYENKNYEESERYVQELLKHPPDQAVLDRVLFLKGKLAEKFEDWAVAETAYKALVRNCPDSPLVQTATRQAAVVARNRANQTNNR